MENEATARAFVGKMVAVSATFALGCVLLLGGLRRAPSPVTPSAAESERPTTTAAAVLDARAPAAIDLGALHSATRAARANDHAVESVHDAPHDAAAGVR
jgi:hypothetical protein